MFRIQHVQMRRLIFVVAHGGVIDVGQLIECEFAVKAQVFVSLPASPLLSA